MEWSLHPERGGGGGGDVTLLGAEDPKLTLRLNSHQMIQFSLFV